MNRFSRLIISFTLALVAAFTSANAASAHNDEVENSPAAGSTVAAGVIDVTANFTEELLLLEDGSGHEMAVTAPDGSPVAIVCLAATDLALNAQMAADQDGEYKVTWRTVSIDGHPVSGSYSFNVENSTGYVAEDLSSVTCKNGGVTPSQIPTVTIDDSEPDFGPALLVLLVGPILAVVAGIIAISVKRKKAKN